VIIAYSPCIAHKIKGGLEFSADQAKLAVESGYWPIFRYNPALASAGKNPFVMDSKEPNWDRYQEFLLNEQRYSQLLDINPDKAEELYRLNVEDAKRRYRMYQRYAAMDFTNEA
jgi:pyruvate-ferredoxin/flavodoxin oxidoreductase